MRLWSVLLLLCTLLAGQPAVADDDLAAFKKAVEDHLRKQAAALNQDLQARRELFERQQAELADQAAAMKAVLKKMTALQQTVEQYARENAALKKQLAKLQAELAAEQQARMAADQKVVKTLTETMARNVRTGTTNRRQHRPAGPMQTYTVVGGDTLSAIAKAFNTTVQAIKDANGMTGDIIRPGQKIKIPRDQR